MAGDVDPKRLWEQIRDVSPREQEMFVSAEFQRLTADLLAARARLDEVEVALRGLMFDESRFKHAEQCRPSMGGDSCVCGLHAALIKARAALSASGEQP